MESDTGKSPSSEETSQLNRNRSFKSKQLVRSQAIRESTSPPRTVSPSVVIDPVDVKTDDATVQRDITAQDVDNLSSQSEEGANGHIATDDDRGDADECKKQQVEIQITTGQWDEPHTEQRQRTKRWLGHRQHSRDLLSNNPRVQCVCAQPANNSACPHCRGRRRRHACPTKQDSGIVCSDDCADCSDSEPISGPPPPPQDSRKSCSLEVDEQTFYCRCPDRKEKPKSISLSRTDSEEKSDPSGPDLINFIKETLNKNARDRMTLLKIEKELHALVNDPGRCIVRFPVMTSYGRMLVHRCAALFQLCHQLDQTTKTCVLVSKSGTSGGRIPCTGFKQWCTTVFPPTTPRHHNDLMHAKSILKRDTHSLDEPGSGALSASRSKSLEQREREYERVRRRIFSSDNCSQDESQWQWLNSGPVKLLTPDSGRNKLLKVQSLEGAPSCQNSLQSSRGAVSKSHSFGGYGRQSDPPRLLSRQGDLASSSWRLSPSSSGYRTLSLHSTDSVTPSPTGGASPEPGGGGGGGGAGGAVVWAVTDLSSVPPGALVIHPQTGRPLTNPDGSVYHFDPNNPPHIDNVYVHNETKVDVNCEKKRGKLEKQHSFIDNECECRSTEDSRTKCCCESRRHDSCHSNKTATPEQKQHQKPSSPCKNRYDSPHEQPTNQITPTDQPTNHRQAYDVTTNQKPALEFTTNQNQYDVTHYNPSPNQRVVFENQRYELANENRPPSFEASHKFEPTNQRPPSELANQRAIQLANQGTPEMQYVAQHYSHGFTQEEVTSPPQAGPPAFIPQDMAQAMAQVKPLQMQDPNMRQMSLGVVYGGMQYPFSMYQPVIQEEHKPQANESTFRIDPSYPYAAMDYSQCGACSPRRYLAGAPLPALEPPPPPPQPLPVAAPIPQPLPTAAYPQYGEGMQWPGCGVAPTKLYVPELWYNVPTIYPHYNVLYPQVIPQSYQVCQPMYPTAERVEHRRSAAHSKRNSISGSSRATPLQTPSDDKKVPYDDTQTHTHKPHPNTNTPTNQNIHNTSQNTPIAQNIQNHQNTSQNTKDIEIAAKIQQIKDQMAGVHVRERDGNGRVREERARRNSGHGILGSYPHTQYNGRFVPRPPNDETQLSSAARAIVNSIRNMQAKNNYHQDRRNEYNHNNQYKGEKEREWRRRDEREREREDRRPPLHYPRDYLLRQMSPGTWCRRSPAPLHQVVQGPRRPPPEQRPPRR